ncbi:Rne/Rng family ribonuclease [Paenibacillus doosanensis]|uniref:Ribonuclease G n=1 Tax=Paenibacillus konkukensis TaxID=2020716 RepID=A0ABY4RWR5_9BACL|nr:MULTISPECIES: Rne/Rng family ribonuclease [Paenibacillus]MCS7458718.1 Rne/Rng family ribonuclease [Paenibacillus doosanensis]UQZ86757.1 Ribonuclease G [Paenibacillus konkukensis]
MKRILVQCGQDQIEVAVMENDRLVEYDSEFRGAEHLAGNMYMGRVVNVLQGMQAAFLDIGLEKNAFLYIDDILPAHLEKHPKQKPPITELVQVGQALLVQVVKEPVGNKGARVTTHYSIPGRWGVYMPSADYVGVSRKIENETERERLKHAAEKRLIPGEGFIARTAAEGVHESLIASDLEDLRKRWQAVEELSRQQGNVPRKVYTDFGLLPRWIRDVFRDDVSELLVNDQEAHDSILSLIRPVSPTLCDRVKRYGQQQASLFSRFHVKEQLENGFKRKIWLDNGGYVVVDHTEALTVFDVNTGRYTGSVDLEQTARDTNALAAQEIARLLRLRDIGGLIIIDFIDMNVPAHRQHVLDKLEQESKKDRTKTVIEGWTRLGLVEMTRKKVRDGKDKLTMRRCTACEGSGWVANK